MRKLIAFVTLSALACTAFAQQKPPTLSVRTIGDRTNMFHDRGSDVELFPLQRAAPVSLAADGKQVTSVHEDMVSTPFSDSARGVLFNYAIQQYGVTNGEISFMFKGHSSLANVRLDASLSAKKITASGVYVIDAKTPQSFLDTLRTLEKSSAVAWVVPTIQYGKVQMPASLR